MGGDERESPTTPKTVQNGGRLDLTFVDAATKGQLTATLKKLPPADGTLSRVQVFSASDHSIRIIVVSYAKQGGKYDDHDPKDVQHIHDYVEKLQVVPVNHSQELTWP